MKHLIALFFFLIVKTVFPQAQYYLCWDNTMSSTTGAEDLISIHKAFYEFENKYLPLKLTDENTSQKKLAGISYRLAKTFINYNTGYLAALAQHEVFGHGSRYREYGQTESSYHLSFPFPLGKGSGYAQSGAPVNGTFRFNSSFEASAKTFGGMEGDMVLANSLRTKWFLNNSIANQQYLLYIYSRHNITAYILSTNYKTAKPNNDVVAYLNEVNYINGNYNPNTSSYNLDFLKKQAALTFLDPLTYIAGFDYVFSYLINGNESAKIPMIKFSKVRYLPSFRLGLSPFGSEYYSEHCILYNQKLFEFYYRQSDEKLAQTSGGGFKISHLVNNKYLALNASADIWNQPKMQLGGDHLYYTQAGIGGAMGITAIINLLTKDNSVGIMIHAGYKTAGYLEGEYLAQSPIIQVGLAFTEGNKKQQK